MDKETSTEFVRHEFTEEEKKDIASEMARKVSELQALEDQKKAIMSEIKGQIDIAQANINQSATKLNNGYEIRSVRCEVKRDYDDKVVNYYRINTDELVKTRAMTNEEKQQKLCI